MITKQLRMFSEFAFFVITLGYVHTYTGTFVNGNFPFSFKKNPVHMCSFKKYLRSHVNRLNFIKSCLVLLTKALKAYTFDILLHYSHFPLLHTHIDGLSAAAVLLSVCITCLMSSYFPIFLYRFTFQNQSLYC